MTGVKDRVYRPRPGAVAVYNRLYSLYRQLHDAFGTASGGQYNVMKELIAIRTDAAKKKATR
jgi:L-ribulokinase